MPVERMTALWLTKLCRSHGRHVCQPSYAVRTGSPCLPNRNSMWGCDFLKQNMVAEKEEVNGSYIRGSWFFKRFRSPPEGFVGCGLPRRPRLHKLWTTRSLSHARKQISSAKVEKGGRPGSSCGKKSFSCALGCWLGMFSPRCSSRYSGLWAAWSQHRKFTGVGWECQIQTVEHRLENRVCSFWLADVTESLGQLQLQQPVHQTQSWLNL